MTQPIAATHRHQAYPLAWIRAQYLALHAEAESDRVFLDNASGSQLPQAVTAWAFGSAAARCA